ncbi:proline-rich transmembrane protein 3 isoform X2 [Protopterus annectens]|uniref:proline-rich transmembrane protein 3 isoform X2 n=1 Tax=Protopterus annectens TaxID=7888 RepID=UPI001CF974D3|nr:proline-rich transmembrane protein 3 isoform X2 [Protopterus annectens]
MDTSILFLMRTFAFLLSVIVTEGNLFTSPPAGVRVSDDSVQHTVAMVTTKTASTDQYHLTAQQTITNPASDVSPEHSVVMERLMNRDLGKLSSQQRLQSSSTTKDKSAAFSGNSSSGWSVVKDTSTISGMLSQQKVDINKPFSPLYSDSQVQNLELKDIQLSEENLQPSSSVSVLDDNFLPLQERFLNNIITTTAVTSTHRSAAVDEIQSNEISSYNSYPVINRTAGSAENIASEWSSEKEFTSSSLITPLKELHIRQKSRFDNHQTEGTGSESQWYTRPPTATTSFSSTFGSQYMKLERIQETSLAHGPVSTTTHSATSPEFAATTVEGFKSSKMPGTTEKLKEQPLMLGNDYQPSVVKNIDKDTYLTTVRSTVGHDSGRLNWSLITEKQSVNNQMITNTGHEEDRSDSPWFSRFIQNLSTKRYATSQVGYNVYMMPTENITDSTFVEVLYPNRKNAKASEGSKISQQEIVASNQRILSTMHTATFQEPLVIPNDNASIPFTQTMTTAKISNNSEGKKSTQSGFTTEGVTYFHRVQLLHSEVTLPNQVSVPDISTVRYRSYKPLVSLSTFYKSVQNKLQDFRTEPSEISAPYMARVHSTMMPVSVSNPYLLAHQISTKIVPHHKVPASTTEKTQFIHLVPVAHTLQTDRVNRDGQTSIISQHSSVVTPSFYVSASPPESSAKKTTQTSTFSKDSQTTAIPSFHKTSAEVRSTTSQPVPTVVAWPTSRNKQTSATLTPLASTPVNKQKEDSKKMGRTIQISSGTPTPLASIKPTAARGSGRRATYKATSQKVPDISRPLLTLTDVSSKNLSSSLPCSRISGSCSYEISNRTLLQWNDLKHTLSFAWEMHVYGTGIIFLILSLIALINLIGSPLVYAPYLTFIMVSNALLFLTGILRAIFLFIDPYGTTLRLSPSAVILLYNITFPLMASTFSVLALLIFKMAKFQILPAKPQVLVLLAFLTLLHVTFLFGGDLFLFLLTPAVNVVLQVIAVCWTTFLMMAYLATYFRLKQNWENTPAHVQRPAVCTDSTRELQTQEMILRQLQMSAKAMMACGVFGLLNCSLHICATLWLFGFFGSKGEFSWSWLFLQFLYRMSELAQCFAMCFVASYPFCQQQSRSGHTGWSKIMSYFCNRNKPEIPEYPNNCYDWVSSPQDRTSSNDISKNIIRNQSENVPLRSVKDSNENRAKLSYYKNGGSVSSLIKPKGVLFSSKPHNSVIGHSYSSIGFDKESFLSLADFDLRPPSPINLSRSIDDALFKEHLVKDSIFQNSSLQCPSSLLRQDSCSSLKENTTLNETSNMVSPANFKRRSSDPDYRYSLARCSSPANVSDLNSSNQYTKVQQNTTASLHGGPSGSSLGSFSKGSIKITWNTWQQGLSSAETIPSDEMSSLQFLPPDIKTVEMSTETEDTEREARKSFIEISRRIDDQSLSSDTIEL